MLARAASIFAIALGIRTWSDGSLEQYSGTALYASMAYTVVLFVLPRLAPLPAAGITIGFCWLVEVFQLTGVLLRRSGLWILMVDHTWQNPNRIPAAQGPDLTVTAVRRRSV